MRVTGAMPLLTLQVAVCSNQFEHDRVTGVDRDISTSVPEGMHTCIHVR